MRFREQTIRAPEENACTAGYLDPKTAHLLYLPVSSTIKTALFFTKIAVSIYSIFIMPLLEISGEHVFFPRLGEF